MNMKLAAVTALGLISLAAAAPQAHAADNGFYLGAGITDTEFDMEDVGEAGLDDNSFKVIAGFRPLNWLAVEANYLDLGSDNTGGVELDASAFTVSGLLIAEVGIVDLYARLGLANWNVDVDTPFGSGSEDDWEPTYGAGIGVHFGSIGARLEYETFEAGSLNTDVNTLSLSVTYTFL